jgi:hypothetical protein
MATAARRQLVEVRRQTLWIALSVMFGAVASLVSVFALLVAMGTGRRQLRAYLMPDHVSIVHPTHDLDYKKKRPKPADIPFVRVHLKNYGSTPATNVLCWVGFELLPFGAENRLIAPTELGPVSESSIAPGGVLLKTLFLERAVTAGEASDFSAGKVALYVRGWATYRDVFKVKRETHFLLRYQGQWPPPPNWTLYYCDAGNTVR